MELGLTPDTRWDTDATTLIDAARAAGFSAVGVHSGLIDARTPAAFTAAGVRCHELLGLVVSADSPTTTRRAEELAADAHVVGARWVNTTFRAPLTDDTSALVARCAAMFAEAGSGMAIEYTPLGPLPTIAAALEMAANAGAARTGIVVDSWNHMMSDDTWDDLARLPLDRVAYVQFGDALAPRSDDRMHEALHRRAMPGDGVLELDRFATTFLDRGWDGVVSVQVLSSELRKLPLPEFARLAHDSTARYWVR